MEAQIFAICHAVETGRMYCIQPRPGCTSSVKIS